MEVNVNLSPMSVAVIITGASRGFGRCLALDFVREIQDAHIEMVEKCIFYATINYY